LFAPAQFSTEVLYFAMRGSITSLPPLSHDADISTLLDLKEEFQEKADMYDVVQSKWRGRTIAVAMVLGLIPLANGVTLLLTEEAQPWFSLFVNIVNVCVVILNIKLDMGERVADASMANKGYTTLVSAIASHVLKASCSNESDATADMSGLLIRMETIQEQIDINLQYPESEPKRRKKSSSKPSFPKPDYLRPNDISLTLQKTGQLSASVPTANQSCISGASEVKHARGDRIVPTMCPDSPANYIGSGAVGAKPAAPPEGVPHVPYDGDAVAAKPGQFSAAERRPLMQTFEAPVPCAPPLEEPYSPSTVVPPHMSPEHAVDTTFWLDTRNS